MRIHLPALALLLIGGVDASAQTFVPPPASAVAAHWYSATAPTETSMFLRRTSGDSAGEPASLFHVAAAGVGGAIGGALLGAMVGSLISEPACPAHNGTDCRLLVTFGTGWLTELIALPYAVHRANGRRGPWGTTLLTSLFTGVATPIVQIPAVIFAERSTVD